MRNGGIIRDVLIKKFKVFFLYFTFLHVQRSILYTVCVKMAVLF